VKVLLVRFSAIGDCAMAAHAASCFRRSYPDGTLVWAVEERCSPVVDEGQLVTEKAVYPRERWKKGAWSPKMWREQMRFYSRLRSVQFDIGLDLQGHSKTAICLRLSGAKKRLATRATDPLARRLNPVLRDFQGLQHTVERQLFALRTLGEFPGESKPVMPEVGSPPVEKPYTVIAVGAGKPWKAYPADCWNEVASALSRERRKVVFLGGPGEEAPQVEGTIDLVGKLSLSETMAAIAHSSLTLAADTGAGHIAAAYGVPVVSVFGPTDPEEFRPYTDLGIVLKNGDETSAVKPEEVVRAAKSLWKEHAETISH